MMSAEPLHWQPDMGGIRGVLRSNEPMSEHTSWRLGGPADWYFVPADRDDLVKFVATLPEPTPIHWVGLGSNLLVRDGGVRGVVVGTHKGLSDMRLLDDGRVYAEAGVASAQVARFCGRNRLAGAEFLAGIPGSLGGALAMNAGAFGGETWQVIEAVDVLHRNGKTESLSASVFTPGYREIDLGAGRWFISAILALEAGDSLASRQAVQDLLKRRGASQPVQSANAGSVFRNPPGDHAARLIEAAGLKGCQQGGAQVSEKHANFIINRGQARASDVEELIRRVQQRVHESSGIRLEPEVRILGEAS